MPYGPGGFNHGGGYTQRLAWGGSSRSEHVGAKSKAGDVCPRCLESLKAGVIRREGVQPLRGGALDALDLNHRPHCQDCNYAETMVRLGMGPAWGMARTAVSNFRQESMRLPGVTIGLGMNGARISEDGELEAHHAWLDQVVPEESDD
jgi:hypothetical protein